MVHVELMKVVGAQSTSYAPSGSPGGYELKKIFKRKN